MQYDLGKSCCGSFQEARHTASWGKCTGYHFLPVLFLEFISIKQTCKFFPSCVSSSSLCTGYSVTLSYFFHVCCFCTSLIPIRRNWFLIVVNSKVRQLGVQAGSKHDRDMQMTVIISAPHPLSKIDIFAAVAPLGWFFNPRGTEQSS